MRLMTYLHVFSKLGMFFIWEWLWYGLAITSLVILRIKNTSMNKKVILLAQSQMIYKYSVSTIQLFSFLCKLDVCCPRELLGENITFWKSFKFTLKMNSINIQQICRKEDNSELFNVIDFRGRHENESMHVKSSLLAIFWDHEWESS